MCIDLEYIDAPAKFYSICKLCWELLYSFEKTAQSNRKQAVKIRSLDRKHRDSIRKQYSTRCRSDKKQPVTSRNIIRSSSTSSQRTNIDFFKMLRNVVRTENFARRLFHLSSMEIFRSFSTVFLVSFIFLSPSDCDGSSSLEMEIFHFLLTVFFTLSFSF